MSNKMRKPVRISRRQHKRCIAFILAATMAISSVVHAKVDLDGMFKQVTRPGAYESQSRMGLIGGSMTVRIPNRPINLMAFDPPRISAGCGGIDMVGGSFSFINAEELTALFRAIVAQAPAVLFKMAIDVISPELGKLMQEFQEKLQALNSMFKNSCSISQSIVSGRLFSDLSDLSNKAADVGAAFMGLASKLPSSIDGMIDGFKKNWYGKTDKESAKTLKIPMVGNLVWRGMVQNRVLEQVGYETKLGSPEFLALMLLNIGGSIAVKTVNEGEKVECSGKMFHSGSSEKYSTCMKTTAQWQGGAVTMRTLIEPEEDATIVGCSEFNLDDPMSCQVPKSDVRVTNYFKGTKAWVNRALFGIDKSQLSSEDMATATGGFVGNINHGTAMSQQDKDLLAALPLPIMRHLTAVQHNRAAVSMVAERLSEVIAEQMAIALAESLLRAGRHVFTGEPDATPPADYNANLNAFAVDIANYRKSALENIKNELSTIQYVTAIAQAMEVPPPVPNAVTSRR